MLALVNGPIRNGVVGLACRRCLVTASSHRPGDPGRYSSSCRFEEGSERVMVKLRARCLLVGDAAVGKSALRHTFQSEGSVFQKNYSMTTGVELITKCVNIPESNDSVELYLLDCPGKELLSEACEKMWAGSELLCLVFDLSSEQSFLSCPLWLQRVQAHRLENTLSGVLVGNKSDLTERRAVQEEAARDWAQENGLHYFETSAKELDTCMAPLLSLAQTFLRLYRQSCERSQSLSL